MRRGVGEEGSKGVGEEERRDKEEEGDNGFFSLHPRAPSWSSNNTKF